MTRLAPQLILISGKKRHGKDQVAEYLADNLRSRGLQPVRWSYADPLKKAAQTIFLLSDDQITGLKEIFDPRWQMTPREILQKLGTEVGRQIHSDVWVLSLVLRAKNYLATNPSGVILVPDTRFPNEIDVIKQHFQWVKTIRVVRPGLPATPFDTHPSETSLDDRNDWSAVIRNASGLETLRKKVDELLEEWPIPPVLQQE